MSDQRLLNLLGGLGLATLRSRLRQRFERGSTEKDVSSFRIDRLNEAEYEALARMQGMPARRASSILVDVAGIDIALRNAGIAHTLKEALERLDGPIVHIATARLRVAMQWSATVSTCAHDGLSTLLFMPSGLALLKRISKNNPATATDLVQRAAAVLDRLPACGTPRALLAAAALGDPHALDHGKPVATLVLAVLRNARRQHNPAPEEIAAQDESVRDIWAGAGVLVNELARPALFLNLPTEAGSFEACRAGEPTYLSLRTLLRTPPKWCVTGTDVFVCENPNLLAVVADRLGQCSAPLVCTEGMPSAAQQVLLSQLARSGADLHYHGDFDWPGIRIGNYVLQTFNARPWRFRAQDYFAATRDLASVQEELKGRETEASWDPDLAAFMRTYRILVSEENVIAQLLPDLHFDSSSCPADHY